MESRCISLLRNAFGWLMCIHLSIMSIALADADKWLLFRNTPDGAATCEASLRLPLFLKWKFQPDIVARRHTISPVTDGENVYYACGRTIYAVNCDVGQLSWAYDAPQTVTCPLAIAGDLVIAATSGGHVIALKAKSGVLEWTFRAQAGIGVPPFSFDGHLLVLTHTGFAHLIDVTHGDELATVQLPTSVASIPAKSGDWLSMITSNRRMLIVGLKRHDKGVGIEVLANSPLGVGSAPTLPIAQSPFVYIGVGRLLCFYDVRWRKITRQIGLPDIAVGAPALKGKTIYIATRTGTVHAIDVESGKEVWQQNLKQPVYSGVSTSADSVFVTAASGVVYALSIEDGKVLWRFKLGDENPQDEKQVRIYSPPVVTSNGLYVTSGDGSLYAFCSDFVDTTPPAFVSASLRVPSKDPTRFILYKLVEASSELGEGKPLQVPGYPPIKLLLTLADAGSGIDPTGFQATCTRLPKLPFEFDEAKGTLTLDIHVPTGKGVKRPLPDGEYLVVVTSKDHAGNIVRYRLRFQINNSLPLPAPPETAPTTPGAPITGAPATGE